MNYSIVFSRRPILPIKVLGTLYHYFLRHAVRLCATAQYSKTLNKHVVIVYFPYFLDSVFSVRLGLIMYVQFVSTYHIPV